MPEEREEGAEKVCDGRGRLLFADSLPRLLDPGWIRTESSVFSQVAALVSMFRFNV
ncbi:hypothetical protein NGF19_20150 [Streptomyces sp. RY43-2]|uniref:Uncharacterized protein n=1 Tax=Streptomyces macrolidinus TaxID=2952607 RepID=A0ABT0ZHM9_9ACTN|nr:hypothetical protein [Streptomyces macrolidinus]MCN9243083.1 hypothetical protein [Streptomyces macrolidinus]